MVATYEEDAKFRREHWNEHFDPQTGIRAEMIDASELVLPSPSDAELQRSLFSDYYGGPVAKAGICNQFCSWIRGLPLCTGRITDSQLVTVTGVLEQQKTFAEADDTHSHIPFTDIVDKGFKIAISAVLHGQKVMQPNYSKGGVQFTGIETLESACVAVVRSGNERAVKWFIKRGCAYQLWDIDLVCDIWEAWTFQVNFMHDKYL